MSLLVTGSIGIDTLETPSGTRKDVLGGSAVYFSLAASIFTPVRMVGVVGEDAPKGLLDVLSGRPVDTSGVEVRNGSKTFRWHGSYMGDLNQAQTVRVDLNVLAERGPVIPQASAGSEYAFLANTHPALQRQLRSQLTSAKLVFADTMNLWIDNERAELLKTLREVDGLFLNDAEARMLTGEKNLVAAARAVEKMGPKYVVIKKGEHGCLASLNGTLLAMPAMPIDRVVDPTGAGDSFAGAFMGYVASGESSGLDAIRRGLAYGTIVAADTVSDFSVEGLRRCTRERADARLGVFKDLTVF